MTRPVVHALSSARETFRIAATGEPLGEVTDLSGPTGLSHLRVQHERLPPGRRSSSPHHHTAREECIYVLVGKPTLLHGNRSHELVPGDFVGLPSGPPAHVLTNETDDLVDVLVFSAPTGEDVVVYERG